MDTCNHEWVCADGPLDRCAKCATLEMRDEHTAPETGVGDVDVERVCNIICSEFKGWSLSGSGSMVHVYNALKPLTARIRELEQIEKMLNDRREELAARAHQNLLRAEAAEQQLTSLTAPQSDTPLMDALYGEMLPRKQVTAPAPEIEALANEAARICELCGYPNVPAIISAIERATARLMEENTTLRNAQKACEDCDELTMEEVTKLRAELAQLKSAALKLTTQTSIDHVKELER